jgi:hypothetical protein
VAFITDADFRDQSKNIFTGEISVLPALALNSTLVRDNFAQLYGGVLYSNSSTKITLVAGERVSA